MYLNLYLLSVSSKVRWRNTVCFITKPQQSFQSHYGPGVDSASNRNQYQEYFLGVKVAAV